MNSEKFFVSKFFLGGKGGGKNMKNPKSYKTSLELIEMLVLILTD